MSQQKDKTPGPTQTSSAPSPPHFDTIVVGAGSAGAVIAARVSEDPNRTVCLIEAGPDYPLLNETPADLVNSHNNSYVDHDWHLDYEPTRGRVVPFPRGRVTGGSSAVNTTIALRGVPEDYDEWADSGCDGWQWDDVLPAFKRLERDLDFGNADYHGDAGPISIRRYPTAELLPQHQAFLATSTDLGYAQCADANDPDGWGAGPHPMNKLGRLRVSTAVGYLAPARVRPNLSIRADSHVRRLLIRNQRCYGLELESGGEVHTLTANTVVLSAGALMSPTILMRSGIGPRQQLAAHGIDVVLDAPGVGANLSDHPALAVAATVRDGSIIDTDSPLIQTILRYTAEGSNKRNDLQIEQISFANNRHGPGFVIACVLEYQYGRGELRLRSADPHDPPVVDNHFCEDTRDATRLTQCFRDTLAFTKTGALAEMIDQVTYPDPARAMSDDDIMARCRTHAGSGFHPCGTVRMGDSSDGAVVDSRGRCYGIDGLVVADASIIPSVPRANTNLTCIMIGEKIGEWLRTEPDSFL